jgi:hypothetical protein
VDGVGSGNWYRYNKKSTTNECQSIDVRRFHRERLEPGYRFSWSWWRAGRQTASIGSVVLGSSRPEQVVLLFRHRSGPSADWEDVQQSVRLAWTPCNFGGEGPGLSALERAVAGGSRSFTDQGNTSCAGTATTFLTRASGTTRCTGLCTGHRTSAGGSEGART